MSRTPLVAVGNTQASIVMAPVMLRRLVALTVTQSLTPSKDSALPYSPRVLQVVPQDRPGVAVARGIGSARPGAFVEAAGDDNTGRCPAPPGETDGEVVGVGVAGEVLAAHVAPVAPAVAQPGDGRRVARGRWS